MIDLRDRISGTASTEERTSHGAVGRGEIAVQRDGCSVGRDRVIELFAPPQDVSLTKCAMASCGWAESASSSRASPALDLIPESPTFER